MARKEKAVPNVCKNCKFWVNSPDQAGPSTEYGLCHRFPTETRKRETDWCGEFQPKQDV